MSAKLGFLAFALVREGSLNQVVAGVPISLAVNGLSPIVTTGWGLLFQILEGRLSLLGSLMRFSRIALPGLLSLSHRIAFFGVGATRNRLSSLRGHAVIS